jgi:hypothetical protein
VIIMDTSLTTCVWRAVRRGRQRFDFWAWVFRWGRTYRPQILADVQRYAPAAEVVRLSNTRAADRWLERFSDGR